MKLSRATLATLLLWAPPVGVAQSAPGTVWTRIEGGPGTGCSHDSAFAFFVHAGSPRHLMVYLEGGGACWNGGNCDVKGKPTYTSELSSKRDLNGGDGILELRNPANPVRDYSVLVVPYCTGDLHLGSRDVSYQDSLPGDAAPRSFVVRHQGARNVAAALQWVRTQWQRPDLVFVTGISAGAIPSPVYAAELAHQYPSARVVQLGDAGGGYRVATVPGTLAQWGATERLRRDPSYRSVDSASFSFESLYRAAAKAAPRVRFAQVNNAEDETQLYFLGLLGVRGARLQDLLRDNLAEIRRAIPRFRSYTAPGDTHTILTRPEFYRVRVDDIALRDWVAGLLDGAAIADVGESLLRNPPQEQ